MSIFYLSPVMSGRFVHSRKRLGSCWKKQTFTLTVENDWVWVCRRRRSFNKTFSATLQRGRRIAYGILGAVGLSALIDRSIALGPVDQL